MEQFPVLSIRQFDANRNADAFYVNTFSEHLRLHHAHILVPHRHDFYLTVLFTKGKGFHEIDFVRYEVKPGTLFFLLPGQAHHWEFSEETEGYVCFHSDGFFRTHFPQLQLHDYPFFFSRRTIPVLNCSEVLVRQLCAYAENMLQEYRSEEMHRYLKLAAMLQCVYVDLARTYTLEYQSELRDVNRYAYHYSRFEALVELHFKTWKTPGFYAGQLHITERHLGRICKETTGKSPVQLITERVLLEARLRIIESEMSLAEIAMELGYEEYAYFSRVFRKYLQESPVVFRKRYR